MRLRWTRLLFATLLVALLAGSAFGGARRAEAAVYWGSGGFVGAANLDGSNFVDGVPYGLANVPDIRDICGIAVSGGTLYWVDRSKGAIGRMGLGSNPTGRVDLFRESVAIDEAFVSGLTSPCGIAVDGTHVYWASMGGMAIGRANLDGGAVDKTFISGISSPCGLAVSASHIYWGNFLGDSVGRATLAGSEVDEGFISGADGPCGVATNGSHIYWANWDASSIGRAAIDGSAPNDDFIGGVPNPCGVAVNGSHVYWTNWNARDPVGRANLDGSDVIGSLVRTDYYLASCGIALNSRVLIAPPPPLSPPIFLGKLKRARGASVFVDVKVPSAGGGTLAVVTKGVRFKFIEPPATDGGYLIWRLKLWPGIGRAGKRIRRALARKGRARLTLRVDYQEAGKRPYIADRPLTLTRRPRRR